MRPSLRTNLLVRNEDYDSDYRLDSDPVLGITCQISLKHFITENATESYTYTSYFSVYNKLPISLDEVEIYISTGETPDQPNVQTEFLDENTGQWVTSLDIPIGHLEPKATSRQQSYTWRIVRVMPAGSLQNFQLNTYLNPTYKVDYGNDEDLFNVPSQIIVES